MSEVFTPQHEMSEFNQGIAIIYRLDAVLKQLHQARASENFKAQYLWLRCFFIELRPNLNEKEKTEQQQNFIRCVANQRELDTCVSKKAKVNNQLIDFLDLWEMDLRDLQQAHNLGMPKQRDARFAMASR